jgi:cellulose synthase (UDP-forming)
MKSPFLKPVVAKKLLAINAFLAVFYFVSLVLLFERGNIYLYTGLIAGEVFHLWQLVTLIHAAWDTRISHEFSTTFEAPIDIYITVAGEPKAVVAKTVKAAANLDYPNFHVYILNDGYVANKPNWQQIDQLTEINPEMVSHITRTEPGGAKAGNINHALKNTNAPFIAILDCDHIPSKDFLKRMAGFFIDPKVAFVQSPQYYHNHTKSFVANAAWQQQTLFFGPICRGKDRVNSVFMCGTNMIIRRAALDDVGGMCQDSITEDLLTALLMHGKGWKSVYVPRILAKGLAPEDLGTYWKQQFRWARGSMEVLFKYNPLFMRGLSWQQKIQYLASVTYYLTGLVVLVDAVLPLFYFYTGHIPVSSATMAIALVFVPYIYITLYSIQLISNFAFSFRAIAFSLASWPIYTWALIGTVLRIPSGFKITSKSRQGGSYLRLALLHIIYILAVLIGIGWAAGHHGVDSSLVTNASWGILYVVMFLPFVRAALSDGMAALLPYDELELPAEELIHE